VADALSRAFEDADEVAALYKFSSSKLPDFQVVNDFIYHCKAFFNSVDTSPDDCWKLFIPESLRQSVICAAMFNHHLRIVK